VESKNEHVVLEVDEGWLAGTLASTRPSVVVLLNLSRISWTGQRSAPPRRTVAQGLEAHNDDKLVVVANANDPLVVYAADVRANTVWCDVPRRGSPTHSRVRSARSLSARGFGLHCTSVFRETGQGQVGIGEELVIDGERSNWTY